MSLKMEFRSKWNALKLECHLIWNVTQNVLSHEMECHSKWKGTRNGMSPKIEFYSNAGVT